MRQAAEVSGDLSDRPAREQQPARTSGLLNEPLLKAEDVAGLLGVKVSSVYEYARTHQIPHVRVGRHVRFVRTDLESWLLGQRQ